MPCLHYELTARKLRFVAQRSIPIVYKGMAIEACYRVDLIVEDVIVVEVKSVAAILVDGVKRRLNPHASEKTPTEVTEATD